MAIMQGNLRKVESCQVLHHWEFAINYVLHFAADHFAVSLPAECC